MFTFILLFMKVLSTFVKDTKKVKLVQILLDMKTTKTININSPKFCSEYRTFFTQN